MSAMHGSRWLFVAICLISSRCLSKPVKVPSDIRGELTILAASSLAGSLEAVGMEYRVLHPGTRLQFSYGGSDLLVRQIEAAQGEGVDLVMVASPDPMRTLVAKGLVRSTDVWSIAGNRMVLVRRAGSTSVVNSFSDLARPEVRRMAVGSPSVPVGHYAQEILIHLGIQERCAERLVFGLNARQVVEYVAQSVADAGIVFSTDARHHSDLVPVAVAEESWHQPIAYLAGAMSRSGHGPECEAFVQFLQSQAGRNVFARYGFAPAPVLEVAGDSLLVRKPHVLDGRSDLGASDFLSSSEGTGLGEHRNRPPGSAESALVVGVWPTIRVSLWASGMAMLLVVPIGTGLGFLLASRRFPGRELLDAVFTLPMILPPTVTGYYLIVLLGAESRLGQILSRWVGVRIPLTIVGAAVASAAVAAPLMIRSARSAFESVDPHLKLVSYSLGRGRVVTLFRVMMPLARIGLLGGVVLSFARAIGEFGATFMLAGMIPGRTMTMPTAVFHAFLQHDDRTMRTLVAVLTGLSLLVIYLTNRLGGVSPTTFGIHRDHR